MSDAESANPLVGTWHLVRWEVSYGDGRASSLPFGPDATGLIVYAPDGWMNASMSRAGRKPLSTESARFAPAGERLAAFDSFFNYGGRYTLSRERDAYYVTHHVTQSANPGMVGTDQKRRMRFGPGDTLTLEADDTVPGTIVARHHRLTWRRPA